ncbi:YmfQ family protein [Paraburkholderia sp. RL17-337-BIB-A]|uniref:YmfQ family protein n=1 Tax=Paraburkholderia sp. RL17-337-BIB-A TaxID=3031636 RepID=UPI0038BD8F9C
MPAPNYSAQDFSDVILALLPRGLTWPRDPDSVMAQTVGCLSPTFARHTLSNNELLVDAFPATAVQLLTEWEETLGLPDPCAGESPTLQGRQAQVVARLTNSGGQSVPYFTAYAQALGYDVTVTEFAPFRAGQSSAGDPCCSADWAFTWKINAPAESITYFCAGSSSAGEPLASWGNEVLQCELSGVKPAHTILNFTYGQSGELDISFVLGESSLL